MAELKNKLNLYRARVCDIENKNIEIEILKISGLSEDDEKIKKLKLEIRQMELENKKIENTLKQLPDRDFKVINLIYLEGKDKKKVARELDRTERQINYSINKAVERISKSL